MRVLMLTEDKRDARNTTGERLREELKRRGHSVEVLCIDDMKRQGETMWKKLSDTQESSQRRRLFSKRPKILEDILVPALENQLKDMKYDFLISTHISAAEIIAKAQNRSIQYVPPNILVSTEYDNLPKKANLASDEYILFTQSACSIFSKWGIPAERIHLVDVTKNTVSDVCDLIEGEFRQWKDLLDAFEVDETAFPRDKQLKADNQKESTESAG